MWLNGFKPRAGLTIRQTRQKCLKPTRIKGLAKVKNEEKRAYKTHNEGNRPQIYFCSANILKLPTGYENLKTALINLYMTKITLISSGNGGIECRDHVTLQRRIVETLFGSALALMALIVGARLQPHRSMKKISSTFSRLESLTLLFLYDIFYILSIQ